MFWEVVNKLIRRVWKSVWKNKLIKYSLGLIGVICIIVPNLLIQNGGVSPKLAYLGSAVSFFIVILILIAWILVKEVWRTVRNEWKKSIYGEALLLLKDGFSRIHQIREQETIEIKSLKNELIYMSTQLRKYFDKKTNSKCCVSIKLFESMDSEPGFSHSVMNLCRDSKSTRKRDLKNYHSISHKVTNNSPYIEIMQNYVNDRFDKLFYINNAIYKDYDNYLNSSKLLHNDNKVPYESEIVCAIIPSYVDIQNVKSHPPLGFLCVDSDKENSFENRYDLSILQGVAEGIYDVILKANKNKNNGKNVN